MQRKEAVYDVELETSLKKGKEIWQLSTQIYASDIV